MFRLMQCGCIVNNTLNGKPYCMVCHCTEPAPRVERDPNESAVIAVDFDGVLMNQTHWSGDHDGPLPGARRFLERLIDLGYIVHIHTCRDVPGTWALLDEHGLSDLVSGVSNTKPVAWAYIDDRGVPFRGDYDEALARLEAFAPWWLE